MMEVMKMVECTFKEWMKFEILVQIRRNLIICFWGGGSYNLFVFVNKLKEYNISNLLCHHLDRT